MRDALASWHMGRVIYAYRSHPYHGQTLSQELVSGWLGLTQPQLSRLENGRAPEELSKLIRYSDVLGIPADLLWFDRPGETRQPAGGTEDEAAAPPSSPPIKIVKTYGSAPQEDGPDDRLDERNQKVDGRRQETSDEPTANELAARLLPEATIEELSRLSASLRDAYRFLDSDVVASVARQLDRCKSDDGKTGPAQVLPTVLAILELVSQQVRDVRAEVRRQLLTVGADSAEFAGWLYRDLHDPASAAHWYDRAMEWAQAAQELPMQGYILLRKSQMAYGDRDAARVLVLAQAAGSGPWQLPTHVKAEVLQQEARGLAMTGEPIGLAERKLGEARTLLRDAVADSVAPLGPSYDEGTWLLRSATCYIEAGKPQLAAQLYAEALARGTLARRDEGYYRARRAVACALAGDPDDASHEGLAALEVADTTSSQRTRREVRRVVRILTPWQRHRGPRELRLAVQAYG
ncbi:XRE family transcriptional regulator [Frankia sp. R43]|uniref:helix-turn-helix domain-containing protein n=1 Tax=Frankia sp. R43 TaxID=269536 RepID=UPI0006D9DCF9|nr:helix-turn-helix transcriptional regulator [Frankia sp. R43]KPM50378.1 XRE family transcriptional regulator [Frankia sp. R43]